MNATSACPPCACNLPKEEAGGMPMYMSIPAIFVLVMMSGLFSGLTLGLLGLDVIGLQIVQRSDDKYLARCADKIAPVREKGNMLLCTLLLGNVAVNSALSILLADIASGTLGFLISTALIVVFGEIIPQASCSRYALQIGARTVPIVKFLMYSPLFLLTKPMSMMLDYALGQEMGTIHSRTELMEMLKLQICLGACDEEEGEMAKQVAAGALCFRDKNVAEVMTPLEDAYMLSTEVRLSYETIREIFETGYSRVPVYGADKNDYCGLLYTKDLMLADPEDEMKLGDFIQIFQRKVETFFRNTKLVEVLTIFKKGGTHMGLVRVPMIQDSMNPRFEIIGVLTLEDVIEEILQDEIVDETDVYIDVDRQLKVEDGRSKLELNLGIFNPGWRRRALLSHDEIAAIGKHLTSTAFAPGTNLQLSQLAVEYLIKASDVRNMLRATPAGVQEPLEEDRVYTRGTISDQCTIVLQGKLGARVGREGFPSELGAFSILGKDALLDADFLPDFDAYISTKSARYICIGKATFQKAKQLDTDKAGLEFALVALAEEAAGESNRKIVQSKSDASRTASSKQPNWASQCLPIGLASGCIGSAGSAGCSPSLRS